MDSQHTLWRRWVKAICAALIAVALTGAGTIAATAAAPARADAGAGPVVHTQSGAIRGENRGPVFAFSGVPYAAPPTGALRWKAPQQAAEWSGVRDATQYAASCLQPGNLFQPPGAQSEDCLYLNVVTPSLQPSAKRPVIVWIHGGGLTEDGARNYDGTKLAATGAVVVTINYRLGALGFLAHPALAAKPGGAAGNYGLMDQQAALRWVRDNIPQFGGDAGNVTIAGQSAGGLSVLAHLVSSGSRGLFQRAIVQSGAFALTQQSLASAEAFGTKFAAGVGCADQSAACLRDVPAQTLVDAFPGAAIPGVVDGKVLTESIGTAIAAGRFAHVPVLNGITQNEELIFVGGVHVAVSGGSFVGAPVPTADTYESEIASVLGVSAERAAQVAAEYPFASFPDPFVALSTVVADANFACTAEQLDLWTARSVPTFAYEFDDSTAPPIFTGPFWPIPTHSSDIQYVLDQPNAPYATPLNATQEALAQQMRQAWTAFAATGDPSTTSVAWPAFSQSSSTVVSLNSPQPTAGMNFDAAHHCGFWGVK